ncbi:DUF1415 domain-containing protein [Piscinibacter sp.]|jgi:hypothetical protein|uniref:DUF1415 domain-containing protein n=1 Tax=Piscinibacter sp. TaxID=1903157 RepID=UPI002F42FB65
MSAPPPCVVEAHTRAWVARAVVGLNLCPFAKAVQLKGQIRCVVSDASDAEALLVALCDELRGLAAAEPAKVDTTLLVHPHVLTDFADFNDFLDVADAAVEALGYSGVFQIASFHPQYRFAGSASDAPGNATNRSPYPTLHLLREASVERALRSFPAPETIYENNIRTLETLGADGWEALQAQCRRDAETPGPRR